MNRYALKAVITFTWDPGEEKTGASQDIRNLLWTTKPDQIPEIFIPK